MPARPMILDSMETKMKGAVEISVAVPQCCVGNQKQGGGAACKKPVAAAVSIRYNSGATDVYILCRGHFEDFKSRNPAMVDRERGQGVFLYAGS